MKLKDILIALAAHMTELRTRANAALKDAGVIEQLEVGQEVVWCLRSLKYSEEAIAEMITKVDEVVAKLPLEVAESVASEIAAKVVAGELLDKVTHDAAIESAKVAAAQGVHDQVAVERQVEAAIAARRQSVVDKYGADVALSIPGEALSVEGFDQDVLPEIGRRVDGLAALGIKAVEKPDIFASVACATAFDVDGNKAFDAKLEAIRTAAGLKGHAGQVGASARTGAKSGSGVPPVQSRVDPPSGKFGAIF